MGSRGEVGLPGCAQVEDGVVGLEVSKGRSSRGGAQAPPLLMPLSDVSSAPFPAISPGKPLHGIKLRWRRRPAKPPPGPILWPAVRVIVSTAVAVPHGLTLPPLPVEPKTPSLPLSTGEAAQTTLSSAPSTVPTECWTR